MAKINFTEVNNLVSILPARQKANYTFEVATTHAEGTTPVIAKDLQAEATTLKAAVKEAGQYIARLAKAYDPEYMMLFFYMNGLFIGTMAISKDNAVIRCDFSGLAISNAVAEETEEPTTEEATETASEAKTMQEIENQAYRLTERNWRRKNVWETSEASKAAKNSRDRLICKAYLNAAAKHLTTKAKAINEFLSVKAFHNDHTVGLDYNSPGFGMYLKIGSPFSVESLLNNPAEVLNLLGA